MITRVAAVLLGASLHGASAQAQPKRLMPFLCRDAVVRESDEKVALVGKGVKPGASVVVGRDAPGPRQRFENGQISRAATALLKYVQKTSGVKCTVLSSPARASRARGPRLFVGANGDAVTAFPELAKADAHGFLIVAKPGPHGTDLHIVSPSGTGTLYGVHFFLMNYAGVRLVMPGEIGEVCPATDRLTVPKDLYVLNPGPDYLLRVWSGPAGFRTTDWLADAGGTQRFQYHHNMSRIYPPKRFGKTNPEFYPIKQGKPAVPAAKSRGAWQPTFSEPAVTRRAIEYADELFAARPDMKSMSLSVNDGLGYSEADIRKGKLSPEGRVSISHIYYAYVNAVARGIRPRWPDRYVAFFPYNLVRTPPDFSLEDNVMIFLLNEPKTTYEAWKGKVKAIGIYQWLYGMHWVIPNHWPHAMQDYLRWVRAHGGKAFKGEAYVAWAQAGPKMWVLNNLLWNVDADVDALLADYYEHAYGKEAAPAMARFFAQAEKIYERRRTPEAYRITIYRPGVRQFEHVRPDDMQIMSSAIDEALAKARGQGNRTRVDMTARCFRWGNLFWEQYAAQQALSAAAVRSEQDVQTVLRAAAAFHDVPARRDAYFKEKIEPLPQYCIYARGKDKLTPNLSIPAFGWHGFDEAVDRGFGAVSAYWRKGGTAQAAAARWEEVSREHPLLKPYAETQRLLLLHPDAPLRNLISNGSFEAPADAATDKNKRKLVAKGWPVYHNRMVNATVSIDRDLSHSGQASLTARGMTDYSGVLRPIRVKNGARYRFSFWYRTSPKTRHVAYFIMLSRRIRAHAPASTDWRKEERVFTVNRPKGAHAHFTFGLCLRHGGSAESQAWFDDVRLEMLAPEGVEGP